MGQITLTDAEAADWIRGLTADEVAVFLLISQEIPAAVVSRTTGISRTAVSRLISRAMEFSLMQELSRGRRWGKTYRFAGPFLSSLSNRAGGVRPYTLCNPHNIRLKYPITMKEGDYSRDIRAGFIKAWKPKGPERLLYWVAGRGPTGDVNVEAHPTAIIAYYSAQQDVVADSVEAAVALIQTSIHEAVLRWARKQADHGCRVDLGNLEVEGIKDLEARQVTATHYAFKAAAGGLVGAVPGLEAGAWWVDKSPEENGDPDHVHVETKEREAATAMDRALHMVGEGPVATRIMALEEIGKLAPTMEELKARVESMDAHLMSGTTLAQKMDQMVGIWAALALRLEGLERRIPK